MLHTERPCFADRSGTAGRFCLPHLSQGSTIDLHSLQQGDNWSDSQALDHRSRSFPTCPIDIKDVSEVTVKPSQWPVGQAEQRTASIHSTLDTCSHSGQQSPKSEGLPQQVNLSSNLHSIPQSAWRQTLDQDQAMILSCDSGSSETISTKKRKTVLVWDLDETLILFHSLLSGVYASHHSPEVSLFPLRSIPLWHAICPQCSP